MANQVVIKRDVKQGRQANRIYASMTPQPLVKKEPKKQAGHN
jgi:hypothetical protein